ncbi:MAG: DNA photolyase family protein [Pirellulales bacterium]|nr:DNA photolyase family protein [Pirellulales bacterium]
MSATPAIVWFQQDLRVEDHPALEAAVARGGFVIPVYIQAPGEAGRWPPGGAARWWLHQSLARLSELLAARGSRLILRQGESLAELREIVAATGADAILWNRRIEPAAASRDQAIAAALRCDGLRVGVTNGNLLWDPDSVRTSSGQPFRVFTPFYRACLAHEQPPTPRPAPARLASPANWPDSLPLAALELEPAIDWAAGMRAEWSPGEAGAQALLDRFVTTAIAQYPEQRDIPAAAGTSWLSPYLHFGEISPRQLWHAIARAEVDATSRRGRTATTPSNGKNASNASTVAFLRQLVWREFAQHLLHHFPETAQQPLRPEFAGFPAEDDPKALRAWQQGRTGYPLVDAGMRQLWSIGWMHNRVRMVVASFLVKHLLIPWQRGAEWFWDTLVDADLANNTLGWQWVAGCGADAAPYFRIFNPVTQSQRFDPAGEYIRRWVPELAELSDTQIHAPWQVPPEALRAAGVVLGKTYPRPIVEHTEARSRALAALAAMKHLRRKTSSRSRGKLPL